MKEYTWKVIHNACIAKDIYEIALQCDDHSIFDDFQPGQFLHVRVPNAKELLLPRPISIHMIDKSTNTMLLQYAIVGAGTLALSQVQPNEYLTAIGTIGRGFPVSDSYQKIWLLGGGLGIPPLYTVTQMMPNAKYDAFLGWRDVTCVNCADRWQSVPNLTLHPYTDNGTAFEKGFALSALMEQLDTDKPDVIFACGPTPMLKALKKAIPADIECYVSMEQRMGCGIGACLVCTCATEKDDKQVNRRVCVDGPVFPIQEVVLK